MSAVAAFGATHRALASARASDAAVKWDRRGGARVRSREAVARSAAADVEAMASVSDAETGAADDDLRFVYVGNFDFFTLEGTIETAVQDALGEALRPHWVHGGSRVAGQAAGGQHAEASKEARRRQAQSRVRGAGV